MDKIKGGEKLFFFLSGIIVGVPVAVLFEVTSHLWFTTLGVATIVAPIIEEFAKANPLFYRYERAAKSLMLFGFLAGLGFGLAEFFVYVLRGVPFFVRLPAIGFHAAGTSIVGYGVFKRSTLRYYFLSVGLHFLNNVFASLGSLWFIGGLGATFASYYLAWRFYRLASHVPAGSSYASTAKFCVNCGTKLSSGTSFCPNCGAGQQHAGSNSLT